MLSEQNTPKYNPEVYTKIALNDLVTYAVFFLSQSKPEITAEDIVAVCFMLFPKRFALSGYSQWPDSTVVNKRWIDCRNKGLIIGSTARGFSLTPKGLEVADRIARILDGRRPLMAKPGQNRVRADKHVVLDLTLLKYKHNQYASKLYGRVTCDHFHALLKGDEPVLTATRDGVNWEHPFAKTLKIAVETELEPLIEEERRRSQADEKSTLNKKLRDRVNNALKELNSIANSELGKLTGGTEDGGSEKVPYVPLSGFGFVPEYVYVQTGKPAGLTLRAAIPDKVAVGSLATVESDNEEVRILTPQVAIEAREDFPSIGQARVEIEGGQVGAEVVITARLNGLEANAMVKVISKREPPQITDHHRHSSGLIREVKFDATAEPKQRVRFDWATASIIIATKAPSVAAYMDEGGKGAEDAAGQVLLAELIIEAVCREIARRGVENGNFLAMSGGEADAVQREYIRLQNQYAHRIHTCFVDGEFRRGGDPASSRKGRPSREQMLAGAVIEA